MDRETRDDDMEEPNVKTYSPTDQQIGMTARVSPPASRC